MPLELPVPDDSPRRPNRRPGVAAPPVSFHEKLPEPNQFRRDPVSKGRDTGFPLGTGKAPVRCPGLAIDSKYAPGPTLRPSSFSANRTSVEQPPPEPQTTPVSATGGQLLPPSSPPPSRREPFAERNARLFTQWDQEEAAKLQESQALQEKRRDHFRTQQQYIGHDPWEHEQMKRALPGVRRRLVGALREPLRQHLGTAFARRGQGRHEAFAGLEAGEVDEKHLDTLRKSHPEAFREYDQVRETLSQSETRKQKDDHFRNQIRNLDDEIFQQWGEGVPTRERLGKHKDDLDTRKEGLDDTGRSLYADAERLQRDFATTLDSLHREEERLLASGRNNPQNAAELQRVRDLKAALGEKHTNAFEELSDRAARHQWETRRYNNSVETYNRHSTTFAEQPPPWDDTPASREITRGAGALPKTLGDEEGRYHPDRPTVTGPDGKPVSALVQHGAYLKWQPTEEAPVVARMEYDKERRRVIVVEDFDALDEVVSHPRRAAGTRAAIYADPNAIGQYLGGSHQAAPRLSDAEADAYIQSANEENRRRIDQIRNLRFRKKGEINDSGRLMSRYAMWRNESLNQALNQFGDGAISLDHLNRFAADLGSPKSGAALFRERLDFYRNLHEANAEAKEKAASFLKTTETWDPKKTLSSLGIATNFGTSQGMYRSIRSMTDAEYAAERLRALKEAGARQAAEKEEQEREALRNAPAELWREIDAIYAKHGVPDEVADQLKMEVAFEGFRSRDRTFLESFVETLNAPAEKLPFTGALAKLEPLLPVMAVYAKAQRAEKEGRDFQLSEDESAIVTSWINEVGRDSTRGAKVFDIVSEIPAFAVELALTGGVASGAKTSTTRGVTHTLQSMLTREGTDLLGEKLAATLAKKKAVDGLSRFAGKVAGGVVEGTLQTPFAGAGRIAAGTLEEKYLPDLGTLADHPDLESWLAAPGKSFTHALAIAGFDTWAEVISEKSGGAFDEAASFLKLPAALQDKAVRAGAIQAVKRLNPTKKSSEFAAFLNRAGVHNFFSELGEERLGEAIRGVGHAATGGTVGEEWKLPTLDDLLTEAIALSVPGGTIATANEVSLRTNHKKFQADRKKEQERYQQIFAGNPENLAARLAKLDPANETIAPEAIEKVRQDFGGLAEQTEGETRAAIVEAEKQYEQARKEGRVQEMKEAGETLRVLEGDKTKRATEEAGALVQVSGKVRKRREMLETAVQFGVANQDPNLVTQARQELLELDRATALIKIGRTGELNTLTPAEENAIDEPFLDGTNAIDFTTGAPIITDAGRQAVLENFPEAERLIPMSEAEARARYDGEGEIADRDQESSALGEERHEIEGKEQLVETHGVQDERGVPSETEGILAAASTTVAPLRQDNLESFSPEEIEERVNDERFRELDRVFEEVLGAYGATIISKEAVVGGWYDTVNEEVSLEVPLRAKFEAPEGTLVQIASIIAASAPEFQNGALTWESLNSADSRVNAYMVGVNTGNRANGLLIARRWLDANTESGFTFESRTGNFFTILLGENEEKLTQRYFEFEKFIDILKEDGIIQKNQNTYAYAGSANFPREGTYGETIQEARSYLSRQPRERAERLREIVERAEGRLREYQNSLKESEAHGAPENTDAGATELGTRIGDVSRARSYTVAGNDTFPNEHRLVSRVGEISSKFGPGAFPGGIAITRLNEGGGLAYQEGKLLVDPARLEQQGRGAQPDWLEAAVTEEFIHRVSTELFTREEITGLWQQLPVEIKKTVKEAYYHSRISEGRELPAEDAWKLGHEFLRMLVQDSHFDGRLTESTAVRSGLAGRVMNLLRRLARRLRELVLSAPQEIRSEIQSYEQRILQRIDELFGARSQSPRENSVAQNLETINRKGGNAVSFNPATETEIRGASAQNRVLEQISRSRALTDRERNVPEEVTELLKGQELSAAERPTLFSFDDLTPELTRPLNQIQYKSYELRSYPLEHQVSIEDLRKKDGGSENYGAVPDVLVWEESFEQHVGLPVQYYEIVSGKSETGGFVDSANPVAIFLNRRNSGPIASVLAHEWHHAAWLDPNVRPRLRQLLEDSLSILNEGKVIQDATYEINVNKYDKDKGIFETLFNALSDALTGLDNWNSSQLADTPESWEEFRQRARQFFEENNPLEPKPFGKGDSELSTSPLNQEERASDPLETSATVAPLRQDNLHSIESDEIADRISRSGGPVSSMP